MSEPKIVGYGRTRREQDLLDEFMLSFITRQQLEEGLRKLHEDGTHEPEAGSRHSSAR